MRRAKVAKPKPNPKVQRVAWKETHPTIEREVVVQKPKRQKTKHTSKGASDYLPNYEMEDPGPTIEETAENLLNIEDSQRKGKAS